MLVPPILSHLTLAPVAYLGPNTVLPLASVLAAGLGIILMFWRYVVAMARGVFRAFKRQPAAETALEPAPEKKG